MGGTGYVIIRSGALGAYVAKRGVEGFWVDAFWQDRDQGKVVDVTGMPLRSTIPTFIILPRVGAGNAFLGGLSAGLLLADGDMREGIVSKQPFELFFTPILAVLYASVAASFVVEQFGLPLLDTITGSWNGDEPMRRLRILQARHGA